MPSGCSGQQSQLSVKFSRCQSLSQRLHTLGSATGSELRVSYHIFKGAQIHFIDVLVMGRLVTPASKWHLQSKGLVLNLDQL